MHKSNKQKIDPTPLKLDELNQLIHGQPSQFINNNTLSPYMQHEQQHQNTQSKNTEEKKRSDGNVSAPTHIQTQNAKLAIQQSKMAQHKDAC